MLKVRRFSPVLFSALLLLLVLACARAAPTATPTRAPAIAPTAAPTTAPAVAPVATATRAPVAVPTATPVPVPATPTAKRAPRGVLNVAATTFNLETWIARVGAGGEPARRYVSEPLMGWDFNTDTPTNNFILESWDSKLRPDGGVDWTWKVRKGVKYQQGWGEVEAADIKAQLEMYLLPGSTYSNASAWLAFYGKDPKNLEVTDPYTLVVHSPEPQMQSLRYFSDYEERSLRPVPRKYLQQVGEEGFDKNPVFAGPYELVDKVRAYSTKIRAVPDFYRVTPGFAEMNWYMVPEMSTTVAMLRAGQVDLAVVQNRYVKEIEAAGLRTVRTQYTQEPFFGIGGLFPGYDTFDPTFPWVGKDVLGEVPVKIRKAFNLVVDRQLLVDKILFGVGKTGVISFSFFEPGFPWWNDAWKPLPYDPPQARQLLKEAGYPNCFEFEFVFLKNYLDVVDMAEAVVPVWEKELGCKIKRTYPADYAAWRPTLLAKKTTGQMYTFGGGPLANPFRYACQHGGPNYETIIHTAMPYYTELCAKARRTLDQGELIRLEREIGDWEYKTFPTVAIAVTHTAYGVGKKIKLESWDPVRWSTYAKLEYMQPAN